MLLTTLESYLDDRMRELASEVRQEFLESSVYHVELKKIGVESNKDIFQVLEKWMYLR